jgi:signal transduction histidine kinase
MRYLGCFVVLAAVLFGSIGILLLWALQSVLGLSTPDGGGGGLVRIATIVVLLAGIAAVVGGIRFARRISLPLTDLVDAAGRVEAGDYTARVEEFRRGPAELRGLARAFNTMTARLETDEAQRRNLLADIGHELRNPLAVVQGNLEALIDGVYPADVAHLEPILDETKVLSRLVEDLRTLSLAEAGTLTLHREPTAAGVLVDDVVEPFRIRAAAAKVALVSEVAAGLPTIDVDPIRIREVLANLVDNALRYVPEGGTVRITARRSSVGDRLELAVADDGPGIPPELLPTIFDRFAKSAESRGSGLGLAIARAIVEAHGGTIAAESPATGGTTIRISLPTH